MPSAAESAQETSDGRIREGKAEILPNVKQQRKDGRTDVFYNPAQVFNRDLSVLVLSCFAKIRRQFLEEKHAKREKKAQESGKPVPDGPPPGLNILEALAATGIRTIRYVKELGEGPHGLRHIVANDMDPTAVEHIRQNVVHNEIPDGRVEISCADANAHMYSQRLRSRTASATPSTMPYDVIDIDPYGSCAIFLDSAVQAVADGGLLCITSTDMPVLGGNNPEACFARYGGSSMKAGYVHEMSLRLVMHAVTTSACKYGRDVRALACCSIDFYVRVFVQIFDSPARAKFQATRTGVVHQCVQCESFFVQPLGEPPEGTKFRVARVTVPGETCPECTGRMKVGGPLHIGPLYDQEFVQSCLAACAPERQCELPGITSWKKIKGLLAAIAEEHGDLPLHYKANQLCKGLKLGPLPLKQLRGTLSSLGYRVSHFHREPEAIKTNAPNAVVYDLMRIWAQENPPKNNPLPEILKKPVSLKMPFEWRMEEDKPKEDRVPKFLPNPEPEWGPKRRAKSGGGAVETATAAGAAEPAAAAVPPSGAESAEAAREDASVQARAKELTREAEQQAAAAATGDSDEPAAKRQKTSEGNMS